MTNFSPELVLFDLDGTLIDSVGDLRAALNVLLAELGQSPLADPEVRLMVGDGVAKLVERALAARPVAGVDPAELVTRFMKIYEAAPATFTTAFPGVPETLGLLAERRIPLAICTNKPESASRIVLKALGLDGYFSQIIGGDSLPWRKPDARVIASVLDGFGVPAERAVLVGDSEVDAAAAAGASVRFLLMTYGYHRSSIETIRCDAALDRFADIVPLILQPAAAG